MNDEPLTSLPPSTDGVAVARSPRSLAGKIPRHRFNISPLCRSLLCAFAGLMFLATGSAFAATHYVWQDSPSPAPPYDSWGTAAADIQSAVNVATNGDTVLVTNGVYALSSTIVVTNHITLKSVNGPETTIVDGGNAVRCLWLKAGEPTISGFTIQNGYTGMHSTAGGLYCADTASVVSNCIIRANFGGSAAGMYRGTAIDSFFVDNRAVFRGGGMESGVAIQCAFSGNQATWGGGLSFSSADRCVIKDNQAYDGGGARGGNVKNCLITGNLALGVGGGLKEAVANNCTIIHNEASYSGGGMEGGEANNCIIWFNSNGLEVNNIATTVLRNSCSPDAQHGLDGNITNAPMLVSVSHISSVSPCRGSGSAAYASGTDIDGEAWLNPPSMGCDEIPATGIVKGSVSISMSGPTSIVNGVVAQYMPLFDGPVTQTISDFGSNHVYTNLLAPVSLSWTGPGQVEVVLTAFNDDHPDGISHTVIIEVFPEAAATIFVSDTSGDDAHDGRSWLAAKKTIQAGVDAQQAHGGTVLVAAGHYKLTRETVVDKTVSITSVEGPAATLIDGGGKVRCLNLNRGALIGGFTITNGFPGTRAEVDSGGGIFCSSFVDGDAIATNCIITRNRAWDGAGMYGGIADHCTLEWNLAYGNFGGGKYAGVARNCKVLSNTGYNRGGGLAYVVADNCLIRGNASQSIGGGAEGGLLNNCTVVENATFWRSSSFPAGGGGIVESIAKNCIVWGNLRVHWTGNKQDDIRSSTMSYTCSPDVEHGVDGNITNAPMFVDFGNRDYRQLATSPCIDAGNNSSVAGITDLDGNPRVLGGAVDIGAYEFVTPELLVQHLIALVNGSNLQRPQLLLATLNAALASIQRGNCNSASGQLGAFQNKVQAQVSPDNPTFALELIQAAQQVIGLLDCDGATATPMAGKLHSLKRHANGKVQLQFSGTAGKVCLLQASTNLVDWETVGVVHPDASGHCAIEDAGAAGHASRFYRVVEP